MNCEIITIGDEILIGQIVDTNSAWIATELNKIGIKVTKIDSISDSSQEIADTLNSKLRRADLVIVTGGLGPTNDDLTKQVVADFFDDKLILSKEVEEDVKRFVKERDIEYNAQNKEQAMIPSRAMILRNSIGTAPGMLLEKEGISFVFMPGVPYEMKALVSDQLIPWLIEHNDLTPMYHQTVLTQGLAESILAEKLSDWEEQLPEYIHLAYLPNPRGVRIRFSVYNDVSGAMKEEVEKEISKLFEIIPENCYGRDGDTLASVVGKIMKERGVTLSTAESCTGGEIASMITKVEGASQYFKGTIVSYCNEAKQNLLGVLPEKIEQQTEVSSCVAESMVRGCLKALNTDYAIATTGYAGSTGGTENQPVGTIWIAVGNKDRVVSSCYHFGKNRDRNIIRASHTALNMLRQFVMGVS